MELCFVLDEKTTRGMTKKCGICLDNHRNHGNSTIVRWIFELWYEEWDFTDYSAHETLHSRSFSLVFVNNIR